MSHVCGAVYGCVFIHFEFIVGKMVDFYFRVKSIRLAYVNEGLVMY